MSIDFAAARTVTVANVDELCDALATYPSIRLAGKGTAQVRIPAPKCEVTVVSVAGMDRILRLEADDLTCSVEPGVRRELLDQELNTRGLCLPCVGTGTIGGMFAADEIGPAAPGQPEPRTLLLGMSAVLSDGVQFKSGARVVKNVAGFDLQKLFVGSRGRLFAVTALHLKLRPLPRATMHFWREGLSATAAVSWARELRRLRTPPCALVLRGGDNEFSAHGTFAGHRAHLEKLGLEFALQTADEPDVGAMTWQPGEEVVQGHVPFRRLAELLERVPERSTCAWTGQRFRLRLPADATDAVLAWLPEIEAGGEIVGGDERRRGRKTPGDPAAERLGAELRAALDPRGVLV